MKKEKLRLMGELARAKNFVLLTDKESIISLPDIDTNRIDDIQLLAHHQSALSRFEERIHKLALEYEKRLVRMTSFKGSNGKRKKTTKIPVKKG